MRKNTRKTYDDDEDDNNQWGMCRDDIFYSAVLQRRTWVAYAPNRRRRPINYRAPTECVCMRVMCKYKYSALKSAKKHITISGGGTRKTILLHSNTV